MSDTRIGIIVPTLNYFEGLAELLASVVTDLEWTPYIQPQWRHQKPLAAAWNAGITQAFAEGCDYAFVLNDDVVLAPRATDALVSELRRLEPEGVVMVTAVDVLSNLADWSEILVEQTAYAAAGERSVADHPNFTAFLVGRGFFDQVGTFDERFVPAWYEDNDMHRRIQLAGKRAVCTTASPTVHMHHATTKRLKVADSSTSALHYFQKWGGMPGEESFERPYNDPAKDWRHW